MSPGVRAASDERLPGSERTGDGERHGDPSGSQAVDDDDRRRGARRQCQHAAAKRHAARRLDGEGGGWCPANALDRLSSPPRDRDQEVVWAALRDRSVTASGVSVGAMVGGGPPGDVCTGVEVAVGSAGGWPTGVIVGGMVIEKGRLVTEVAPLAKAWMV